MIDLMTGMASPAEAIGPVDSLAWQIGADVAAPLADEVDREARFPSETVAALKEHKLLSAMIPEHLGGGGASIAEVASAVRALSFHCTSSALVLAMHSIEISNLVRHGSTPAMKALLQEIASDQLLIANANSEVGIGGDVGRSHCAIEPTDDGLRLEKQCLAISYGEYADAIVATARARPDSEQTDQVQAFCRREDLTLEQTSSWDTLGLRATCSNGFTLRASVDPDLIYPVPFAVIAGTGGLHSFALLLSGAWVGLAEVAASKAHAFVRAAGRRKVGTLPPAAPHLAALAADLQQSRALLATTGKMFLELDGTPEMESPRFVASARNLKVATSELAVRISTAALGICGIAGYKADTPYSLGRHVRDAHGSVLMVSNERYLLANAEMLLARKHL